VFVDTDDSDAASGLPAPGDSAGEQPVATIAATPIAEWMNLRFIISPSDYYSGVVIVAAKYQNIPGTSETSLVS